MTDLDALLARASRHLKYTRGADYLLVEDLRGAIEQLRAENAALHKAQRIYNETIVGLQAERDEARNQRDHFRKMWLGNTPSGGGGGVGITEGRGK